MKKYTTFCAALCVALTLASCGVSKESAYRKAYEKAKAQEQSQMQSQQQYAQQQYVQQDPAQQYQQPVQQQQYQQYQQPVQQQQYQQPVQQQYQQPVQQQQYQQPVQQQYQQPVQQTPVVTQMTEGAPQNAPVQQTVASSNITVRQAAAGTQVVSGTGLKNFSVVVGAFGVRANAEGLQNTLKNAGYQNAQVTFDGKMYRVVASTYDDKESAARDKNALSSQYSGAWIMAK